MYINPLIELIIRYLYFKINFKNVIEKINIKYSSIEYKLSIQEIKKQMESFNIKKGDSIMVHSSFCCIDAKAEDFIAFLKDYIGINGNILVPTHPKLLFKNGELIYDVKKSPSTVGYFTEMFRKSKGVKRSYHPFSSIAVWGKDSDYLLNGNLNNKKPLPHGKYSSYYKFSQIKGKVLCIGVTAIGRATIKHVAEEVLDNNFAIKNFFKEYDVVIKNDNRFIRKIKVRKSDLNISELFVAKSKIQRDWLKNNILIKHSINKTPIEYLDAYNCVKYMIEQAKKGITSYPYAPKNNYNFKKL